MAESPVAKKQGRKKPAAGARKRVRGKKAASAKKTPAKKPPSAKKAAPPKKTLPRKKRASGQKSAEESWKVAHLARNSAGELGVETEEGFYTLEALACLRKKIRVIVSLETTPGPRVLDVRELLEFIQLHAGVCAVDESTCLHP